MRFCRFRDKKCTKSSADKSANKHPHSEAQLQQPLNPAFSEEDVQLVADQTGKSLEKAKEALQECGGDLAKAILLLQS